MRAVTEAGIDTHFYIDNAPPDEVARVLRCLSSREALTPDMLSQRLLMDYGFKMQKDATYSPKRLSDLGLAVQVPRRGALLYEITELGHRVLAIQDVDRNLYSDIMHYLHFVQSVHRPESRKYLWSYRQCCEMVWSERRVVPTRELAGRIQALIGDSSLFPGLDMNARVGARFEAAAAGRFYSWLRALEPSPFQQDNYVHPRTSQHHELALLSLDHVYRARGYRHGDPVVLDENLLDECARVFFLDHDCWRSLISLAVKVTGKVALRDTFAGTAVTLTAPYTIFDV